MGVDAKKNPGARNFWKSSGKTKKSKKSNMSGEDKLSRDQVLVLFDVDGTLTAARQLISPEMDDLLRNRLSKKVSVGLVSGSDLCKVAEQMGGPQVVDNFDFVFPENGLVAYKQGKLIGKESIANYIGEEKLQKFINFCLKYMSELTLPFKRGNFVEFRNGLINVCPVGRSVSQEQRTQFYELDKKEGIRKKLVEALEAEFPEMGLTFAIGGQISIDAYPKGWDKRYCLNHVEKEAFKEIHFFGDKTEAGGNDHDLFADDRTIGHAVKSPQDTMKQLAEIFDV